MSAETPLPWRTVRVLIATVLAAVFLWPGSGARAETTERESPIQGVLDSLESSHVHVDPAYESAFPPAAQERLSQAIESSGLDLYLVAVPLVDGDAWDGEATALVSVLHDRRGGERGHYLVHDGRGRYHGADFGPGSGGGGPAHYGALTASYVTEFEGSLLEQAEAAVETALSDDPAGAYEEAVRVYEEANPHRSVFWRGGNGTLVAVGGVVAVLLALVLGLLVRGRLTARRGRTRAASITQHAAFDNADRARLASLVEQGGRDLIEVGERLSALGSDGSLGPKATESLQRALDARSAAAGVHDRMVAEGATLPDAVGVLVLLDMAEDEMEAAARGARPVRRRHCYANPLHGTRTKVTTWREFGGARSIRVPLCVECARAVRERTRPAVLPAEYGGETLPYYEVPARHSVWAATGYGTLTDDLVQRIQRGDHRR